MVFPECILCLGACTCVCVCVHVKLSVRSCRLAAACTPSTDFIYTQALANNAQKAILRHMSC